MPNTKPKPNKKHILWAKRLLRLFGPRGEHWAKDASAYTVLRGGRSRHRNDTPVTAKSVRAQSWCLLGACWKLEIPTTFLSPYVSDLSVLLTGEKKRDVPHFNDSDGWTPVKRLLQHIAKGYVPGSARQSSRSPRAT